MTDILDRDGAGFLIIGRAGMDLYADPPGTTIETATAFTAALGGSSANIAAGLCRQGMRAALVTCVSDDAVGRFCLAQLDAYGIDRRFVRAVGGEARNSLAVVETRLQDTQSVIYRNGAADFEMRQEDVRALPYAAFQALVTTGTVLATEPSRSAALSAVELAKAVGLPVVFDVDYRPYTWASAEEAERVYSHAATFCDIIVGNDEEFGFMAGDYDRGLPKARALAAETARIVVYKMGERGAVTITRDGEVRTGIFETGAIKPTGAGDAFMAGFLGGLAAGVPVAAAVERGSAAAAIVVSRVGCAPAMPTADELARFMASHTLSPIQQVTDAHPAP
ncbi:5-dehydro-2-deoxygluconokinase [Salipiger sp. IMCC34102]|uniref:5-dehydro-2-deoxygluconokinase n=1 Tax=Salipiger sp. IMCC34102 TaxID=2510647 RepID=UPI00210246C4|nr:5-dehydro-2-deoxygluconokinase [Salipiger sp. IMCC34102]